MTTNFSINYVTLFNELCHDLQIPSRTVEYCLKRVKHEGLSFLTVTLPKLANQVTLAVELGSIVHVKHELTAFDWKGNALRHFDELILDIFETDGSVKINTDLSFPLWRLRQFSLYFYKLCLSFKDADLVDAEKTFLEVDSSVGAYDNNFVESMRKNMETYYKFPKFTDVLANNRPRFGPGTFSDNQQNRKKIPYWLEKVTPAFTNGYLPKCEAYKGYFKEIPSYVNTLIKLDVDTADYSEVCFVPKDSRGPRVITREPAHQLKVQMSFFDYFSKFFEVKTKNRINFSDQGINQNLARIGSIKGDYATLDLKDASDRVSYDLVKQMSRFVPVLRSFLKFRSSEALLPSGKKHKLKKLAGMGSGLTFIWLALVCHTAIATEISQRTGVHYNDAASSVFVYGDDIVVSSCHVDYAQQALKKVGLAVNSNKSFYRKVLGSYKCFRESCGGDFFGGTDVGISRLKLQGCSLVVDRLTTRLIFSNSVAQTVTKVNAHAAEMSLNGHKSVSKYLYNLIKGTCGALPKMRKPSAVVGEVTREFIDYPTSSTGQYHLVKVTCTRAAIKSDLVNDISGTWHYSQSLNSKKESDMFQSGYTFSTRSTEQFEMTVPRSYVFQRTKVSGYSLM